MSLYRMTVTVEIDDGLLADHDGKASPPPNDVMGWYGGDLERALEKGFAALEHDPIEDIQKVRVIK